MALLFTAQLSKDARKVTKPDYTIFFISFGKSYKDRNDQRQWTNYTASIFAKSEKQISYFDRMLVAENVIEISAKNQRVEVYEGVARIELLDATLEQVFEVVKKESNRPAAAPQHNAANASPAPQYNAANALPEQQGYANTPLTTNAAQQTGENAGIALPADDLGDDIPF